MSLAGRFAFVAGGLVLIAMGAEYLRRGIFSFDNASYRQTVFSAGSIGTGVLLLLFAFLPSGDWIYRRITTRRKVTLTHHSHHSKIQKTED
jgi:hypothetical protein